MFKEINIFSTIPRKVTVHEVLATFKVGKVNFKVKKNKSGDLDGIQLNQYS